VLHVMQLAAALAAAVLELQVQDQLHPIREDRAVPVFLLLLLVLL
jgi:hypothetical protein